MKQRQLRITTLSETTLGEKQRWKGNRASWPDVARP